MDNIIELADKIDNLSNINDKIKLIKSLNEMIEIEKNKLNNILDNDIKNIKTKIPIKYKKMSIDELEDEFEKCNNINEKILIYTAIDKYYSNIEEELFEIE
jgi:hypothetical protein